ncbi:MAG: betaine/proline/choline family ABC transporter ATP-binding protein [Firmicutes bacterium]|nr:betaine/proline/choline family ABC transporter ATP-binding protein [Bacillota bacterium]
MLRFEQVTKIYSGQRVVDCLDLEVKKGEFLVLIGPSGCGKTTTLKMINRLIEPSEGKIYMNGTDISRLDPVQLRRQIGYVIQQVGLFPNMTIQQNVDVVLRLLKRPLQERQERVRELLAMVGMDPALYAERYPNELSGGQQQRIGVLRALAADPPLILMDEPFGALDPITRESLQDEFKRLQEKLHKTIVFVTHDMDEALKLADRIVLMKDGRIVQAGPPEELLRHPANDFVAFFFGKKRKENEIYLETVDEVMNPAPVTIRPEQGVAEGVELMRRRHVDSLFVVDKEERFLGQVTIESLNREHLRAHQIIELLDTNVPTVLAGSKAETAFRIMTEQRLKYVPVVDTEGRLVGLVTRTSMVNALASVVWGDGISA